MRKNTQSFDSLAPIISIVCPFYNEGSGVEAFFRELSAVLEQNNLNYEIVAVDDGSTDDTLKRLHAHKQIYGSKLKVVELSRNFGKESALTCALDYSTGQTVVPIDADLQDPPEVIPLLLEKWQEGYDVVVAVRGDRTSDSFFKRLSANAFYYFHNLIAENKIPQNAGDFRLMDRMVVDVIKSLPENRRFMKGIFAWVGFRTAQVSYKRDARSVGASKFNGWKLWLLATEGITSFSTAPLRIWLYLGSAIASVSFLYAMYIIWFTLFSGVKVPGYASLLTVVLFLGGIQLIGIGILGEYLGRTYIEAKGRPVYIVRSIT